MLKVIFRSFDYRKDMGKLFEYMMNEDNQILFSHGFQMHNLEMFEAWITNKFISGSYHDFFMIENTCGQTIGFTFSYDFFNYDSHCKYTLCLFDQFQNVGYGAVSAVKMIDYLFSKYPLKRVFVSVFDYNANSLENNLKGGFTEVGNMPEYRYKGGEYYSLHILTMSRKDFYDRYHLLIKIINRKGEWIMGYYDGKGYWRNSGEGGYDSKGYWRNPGEGGYDYKGYWRNPGEGGYDSEGYYRSSGEGGYDSKGYYRDDGWSSYSSDSNCSK